MSKKVKIPIVPKTKIKIVKLWPHARKQGKEIGQVWKITPGCKDCGKSTIWLKNSKGQDWTVDKKFLERHFILA